MSGPYISSVKPASGTADPAHQMKLDALFTPGDVGTYAINISARHTGTGATTTKAITYKVPPVAKLIGFDCTREDWAATAAKIGAGQTHRVFYDGGSPDLPSTFESFGVPSGVTFVVSFKDLTRPIASYVNSIPDDRDVIIIYFHEPENDFSDGANFNDKFRYASDIVLGQGRENVRMAMCAMSYQYRTGKNTSASDGDYLYGLGDVSPVTGKPYAEMFLVDTYEGYPGAWNWPKTGLPDDEGWVNWYKLVNNPEIVGTLRPLGFAEFGMNYDKMTPLDFQTRMTDIVKWLRAAFGGGPNAWSKFPLQLFCYWYHDNLFSHQFKDDETIGLWREIQAGNI
jgi:hypothetical protein